MTDEAKKMRNEYVKQWRNKNKDKVKAYNEKHWEKLAAQKKAEKENGTDLAGGL